MTPVVSSISYPCQICLETDALFVRSTEIEGDNTDHKIHEAKFHVECIAKWIQTSLETSRPPTCPLCRERITHVNGITAKRFLLDLLIHRVFPDAPSLPPVSAFAAIEDVTRATILREATSNPEKGLALQAVVNTSLNFLETIVLSVAGEAGARTGLRIVSVDHIIYNWKINSLKQHAAYFNQLFFKNSDDRNAAALDTAVPDVTNAVALLDHIASSVFKVLDDSLLGISYTDADRSAVQNLISAFQRSPSNSGAEPSPLDLLREASQTPPYEVAASDAARFERVLAVLDVTPHFVKSFPYAVVRALGRCLPAPATQPETL